MGNRQTTDNRKSTTTPASDVTAVQDSDWKQQSQPEVVLKKRRRGRGRKVTDVAVSGPSHPELISTKMLDTGDENESGNGNKKLLHLTIYRSYSGSNGSSVSHGISNSLI